ncbi:uncharacterized protein SPPG_05803 [Spizellomyces punctatus DAOM BR117]|uniref:MCM C-terminal AAA(+) ATPase domain-containing protein n=1 Tax=Spizellomyces punctatus (strain DAOM BR117) TaxID=645134 RepID=A0A0L0HCV8_SPIPD|nr:uncharacterized protein SPPG_05803 [Spizellomyces punctatus DAOM BR117]KNC98826.1 hypothetical protein SPPG_05803 [Spizellomyces punctatus DAOM BR117]|eukprot:XP_016606866.1 hypothetical protein SPPG_05803 [Spizellomyces punctatus DAOM BR117]
MAKDEDPALTIDAPANADRISNAFPTVDEQRIRNSLKDRFAFSKKACCSWNFGDFGDASSPNYLKGQFQENNSQAFYSSVNPNLPVQPGSGSSRQPTLPQQQCTEHNSYRSSSSQLQAPPTPVFRPAVFLNSSCSTPVSSTGSRVSDSRSSTPCPAKSPSLQLATSLFSPPIRGPEDENFISGPDDLESVSAPETEPVKISDNTMSRHYGYAEEYMPDSANRSTRERIIEYIQLYHIKDIMKAIFDAQRVKAQRTSTKERYCVILHIDPAVLLDYDENIGNELIRGLAENLKEDFASACFWHIEKATRAQSTLFPEHVRAAIRLAYLPAIPELHFYNLREVFNHSRGELCKVTKQNLVAIRGIVSCLHLPFHTIYSQTYGCLNPKCRNRNTMYVAINNRVHRVVKRAEDGTCLHTTTSATVHDVDLNCSHCGDIMLDMAADRVTTVRQKGQMLNICADGCFSNEVTFDLEDDLVNVVQVGDYIELIGSVHAQPGYTIGTRFVSTYRMLIRVNNARKLNWTPALSANLNLGRAWTLNTQKPDVFGRGTDLLPQVFLRMQQANLSPYAFSQKLVDSFCHDVVPRTMWRKAKLAMLLSLVSLPSSGDIMPDLRSQRQSVNLLYTVDLTTPVLLRLILRAASLRRNQIWTHGIHSKHDPLLQISDSGKLQHQRIQASPLTQARDGVLFVELDKLSRKQVASLSEAVATPILRGLAHGEQIVPLHANVCVWGSACTHNAKNKRWDPEEKTSLEKTVKEAVKPLLSKFDVVLNMCQSSTKSKHDEIISGHILSQEMRKLNDQQHGDELTADPFYVSHEDFVQFVHAASNITVKLSLECQTFLRSYFSALRRLVGNIPSAADSMLAKMETLIRLACCHAKLCLRDTALIDDGLVSILFVEETMAAAHGISILGFNSLPNDQENLHVLFGSGEQTEKSGQRVPEREEDVMVLDSDSESDSNDDDFGAASVSEMAFNRLYAHTISILDRFSSELRM